MAVSDSSRLSLVLWGILVLCALTVSFNIASEYFLPELEGYVSRRMHYEKVISKKGLSMYKARHWKRVQE